MANATRYAVERQDVFAGGFRQIPGVWEIGADEAMYAFNWRLNGRGRWQVRFSPEGLTASGVGSTYRLPNGGGSNPFLPYGMFPYNDTGHWIAFSGAAVHRSTDYGATWTTLATGLREDFWDATAIQIAGTKYLCFANGGANSYYYDGTNWGTITNIPANTYYVEAHNNRLWASTGDGRVYASKIDDINTWATPDGLVLPVATEDSSGIRGLASFAGRLIVFRRSSISYVDGYGNADVVVATGYRGISRSVGLVGFRSIAPAGDATLIFASERGIEALASDMSITKLSGKITDESGNFNLPSAGKSSWITRGGTRGEYLIGAWVPSREEYILWYPSTYAGPGCSSAIHWSLRFNAGWFMTYAVANADFPTAVMVTPKAASGEPVTIFGGKDNGFLFDNDSGTVGKDMYHPGTGAGTIISARLRLRPMFFGSPETLKRARICRLRLSADQSNVGLSSSGTGGVTVYNEAFDAGSLNTTTLTIEREEVKTELIRVSRRGRGFFIEIKSQPWYDGGRIELVGAELQAEIFARVN